AAGTSASGHSRRPRKPASADLPGPTTSRDRRPAWSSSWRTRMRYRLACRSSAPAGTTCCTTRKPSRGDKRWHGCSHPKAPSLACRTHHRCTSSLTRRKIRREFWSWAVDPGGRVRRRTDGGALGATQDKETVTMPQYLLSVWHDGDYSDLDWSSEDMQRIGAQVNAVNETMRREGAWVFGAGLRPTSSAT